MTAPATSSRPLIGCLQHNCFDPDQTNKLHSWKKLTIFHGKVVRTFDTLPDQHKLKVVATRCLIIALAPLIYVGLLLNFAGDWLVSVPRDKLNLELDRLRRSGVLTSKTEADIDAVLTGNELKVLISQAFEIKRAYGKDHFVFTHAQGSKWYVVSQLIKALVKRFEDCENVDSFEFLRSTKHTSKYDAQQYASALESREIVNDHDKETRASLVSSDAYLLNNDAGESALSYLKGNYNNLCRENPNAISEVCETILKDYLPEISDQKIKSCAQKIGALAARINTVCGHLFVICIPKFVCEENLANVGYLSHAWGKPCKCHPDTNPIAILEGLQTEELNDITRCKIQGLPPQFRMMPTMVTPNIGTHSFILSTLTTQERMSISQSINALVDEISA